MLATETPDQLKSLWETFYPCPIGDPVGQLEGCHFFPETTPWLWSVATLCLTLPLAFLILTRQTKPYSYGKTFTDITAMAALTMLPPMLSFALGLAAHAYWGGPFNYDGYRIPKQTADVVIWFTGSDDGTFTIYYPEGNICRAICQFGYGRTALFSFADVDKALNYARQLPPNSRLIVRGHSMGAAAALQFAEQSPCQIMLLDTRDPTSWTKRMHQKPAQVRHWRNLRPEIIGLFPPQAEHRGTNYMGPINMANLFRILGGAWKPQPGAQNITLPRHDHHSIGNNLPLDPCVMHMDTR